MHSAYLKDIWRTICKSKKRFIAIVLITTLSVTMLTGLKAACTDLKASADDFFDNQYLFDLCILSTLGLTDEDVTALSQLNDIDMAEGTFQQIVHLQSGSKTYSVQLHSFQPDGMNIPYLTEGRLPSAEDEIAVTGDFMTDTNLSIGSQLTIDPDTSAPSLTRTTFTITGTVINPLDVNNSSGATAFRSTSTNDYTFFVTPEVFDSDIYTSVYLSVNGTNDMLCYSNAYQNRIDTVITTIESTIKSSREQARYNTIVSEANDELADAESEMYEEFEEADAKLADAEAELADGRQAIDDGRHELEEQEATANAAFAKARQELNAGFDALADGQAQLDTSAAQLTEGQNQLTKAKQALQQQQEEATSQLQAASDQITDGISQATAALDILNTQLQAIQPLLGDAWPSGSWQALVNAAHTNPEPITEIEVLTSELTTIIYNYTQALEQQITWMDAQIEQFIQQHEALDPEMDDYEEQLTAINAAIEELMLQKEGIETQRDQLVQLPSTLPQLAVGLGQAEASLQMLKDQQQLLVEQKNEADAQFEAAWQTLQLKETELQNGILQLEAAQKELDKNKDQLTEGAAELSRQETDARIKIEDGRRELADGEQKLLEGEQKLLANKAEYEEKKHDALEKIEDARKEIEDIDMTEWYIQDRHSLGSFASIESDASSIETIGTVFPIIFFIVAILISLTTMTRMVEEDRSYIGTYKALGFTSSETLRKYALYALSACLLGGILGDFFGFIVLPAIVFTIFDIMYILPYYFYLFDFVYGIGGILLFVAGITGAALLACRAELRQTPSALMRPKSPRAGSKVFLEYIKPIWNRFSFLNKITARNLFRYKKRLLMTIFGIMGCTALVLCGFAIKDSVTDLMPGQYENIYRYALIAAALDADNDQLLAALDNSDEINDYINIRMDSIKLLNDSKQDESVQLIVIPDNARLDSYIHLENTDGQTVYPDNRGIFITQNAARMLHVHEGDTVSIQNQQLEQADTIVSSIVKNYLGNHIYMTQTVYEQLFGELKLNSAMVHLSADCTDSIAFSEQFNNLDGILSATSTDDLRSNFTTAFTLINMVVYIIIFMAAGLALVVLFTLATTNISERERELATIKVLGFYDREVHTYVNKETLILTLIGILLGLPLGNVLGHGLTAALKMPSIHFAVSIHPISYVLAAVISFVFALLVDLITNRILDAINPSEALKSIE